MLDIAIKPFNKLSTKELYDILRLRSEVFVVEQNCAYQDLDGKDEKALHVIGTKDNHIVAYTRIFKAGDYYLTEASIGRVVVKKTERKNEYGQAIMKASIEAVGHYFEEIAVQISAQTYLIKFYKSLGFEEMGEQYLEDGIPHIKMARTQ